MYAVKHHAKVPVSSRSQATLEYISAALPSVFRETFGKPERELQRATDAIAGGQAHQRSRDPVVQGARGS